MVAHVVYLFLYVLLSDKNQESISSLQVVAEISPEEYSFGIFYKNKLQHAFRLTRRAQIACEPTQWSA